MINKALLVLGIAVVGIAAYDETALLINNSSPSVTLPFIWQGTVAEYVSELWLVIIGAILILIAAFVNLG